MLLRFIQDWLEGSKIKNHGLLQRLCSTRLFVLAAYHRKLILRWISCSETIKPALEPDFICYCSHSGFPWAEKLGHLYNIWLYLSWKKYISVNFSDSPEYFYLVSTKKFPKEVFGCYSDSKSVNIGIMRFQLKSSKCLGLWKYFSVL